MAIGTNKKKNKKDYEDDLKKIQKVNTDNSIIGPDARNLITVEPNSAIEKSIRVVNVEDEYKTDKDNLLAIRGKDKQSGAELLDIMNLMYKQEADKVLATNYERYIRGEIRDNRFMINNMDPLSMSMQMRKTSLLNPDDGTKKSFIFSIPSSEDDLESANIEAVKVEKQLEKELNYSEVLEQLVDVAGVDGYAILYKLPFSELATQFHNFVKADKNRARSIYEAVHDVQLPEALNIAESADGVFEMSYDSLDKWMQTLDVRAQVIKEGYNRDETTVYTDVFGSLVTDEARDAFMGQAYETQMNNELDIKEAGGDMFGIAFDELKPLKKNINLSTLSGVHLSTLDNERTIPIVVNKKLIGVYYIEEYQTFGMRKILTTKSLLEKEKANYIGANPLANSKNMMDAITKVIERNLNTQFLKSNKHILGTLRDIFNESLAKGNNTKVRFIPAKYLELYVDTPDGTGLGKSPLQYAKNAIYSWILLNKNMQMTELYYKRPKMIGKINVAGLNTDMGEFMWKGIEAFEQMYNSATLHNITDVQSIMKHMSAIGRTLYPVTGDGKELISIERIEGQSAMDNMELLRMYEKIVAMMMSTMVSSDEDSYINFATSYANRNIVAARENNKRQAYAEKQFSRITTNLYNLINPDADNIEITIKLPSAKTLTNTTNNNVITDIIEKAKSLATAIFPEEVPKQNHFVLGYISKNVQGLENMQGMVEEIMKSYKPKVGEDDKGGGL